MDTITKLIELYNDKSNENLSSIAGQILKNLNELALKDMSIYDFAAVCYTTPSSLSRFARKLEYSNFNGFRTSLQLCYLAYPNSNRKFSGNVSGSTESTLQSYTQFYCDAIYRFSRRITGTDLEKIAACIDACDQLHFMCTNLLSFPSLQYDLSFIGRTGEFEQNMTESFAVADLLTPESFVIFFVTTDRQTARGQALLEKIKGKKCPVLLLSPVPFKVPKGDNWICINYDPSGTDMDLTLMDYLLNLIIVIFRARYVDGHIISDQGPQA